VLTIDRVRSFKPRYLVKDDGGERGAWGKERLFGSKQLGDVDGRQYVFRDDGRNRFVLTESDQVAATAEKGKKGSWALTAGDWSGEMRPASDWRSELILYTDEAAIGTIKKGKLGKSLVVCELPSTMPLAVQTFVGFLALTVWNSGGAEPGLAGALGQT
jgi:hypothetical protein